MDMDMDMEKRLERTTGQTIPAQDKEEEDYMSM